MSMHLRLKEEDLPNVASEEESMVQVRILQESHEKSQKPDKNEHENGKSTQELGVCQQRTTKVNHGQPCSKEAQGLQEGRIAKLAIRVTLFNPRATIKGAMISRDQGTRLKMLRERLKGLEPSPLAYKRKLQLTFIGESSRELG
ncbi:hypothetical protein Tco_0628453 [Tanacetum coccineum]|uniref:Ubiquitin-like domain-containing protein n=1 Tax=Tanacetum coccineum TaxID=301880 RepID=A0ABQ4WQC5_9ASTR